MWTAKYVNLNTLSMVIKNDVNNTISWRTSTGQNLLKNKNWEKVNIDTINWEKLYPPGKIYWKKYREKINEDSINWEHLFDRSVEHKKMQYIVTR